MKKILSFCLLIILGITLIGCNNKQVHTVEFDSQGGSVIHSMTIEQGMSFTPSELPVKDGYTFSGWYLDPNHNFLVAFNAGVTKDLTLYAKWTAVEGFLNKSQIEAVIDGFLADFKLTVGNKDEITKLLIDLLETKSTFSETDIIDVLLSNIDILAIAEEQITTMLTDVSRSVVMVDCYLDGQLRSGGSGVIYRKVGNTYYVLTNEHVVSGYSSEDIKITIFESLGDQTIELGSVELLGTSVLHDLAVLRFDSIFDLRVIEMGNQNDLEVGQIVFSIGSPLDLPNTASMGVISAFDRPMSDSFGMDTITIQHTASINPGNSGGALVNIHGQLIGINTMSYVNLELGEGINSLHFAVQIDILTQMITSLQNQT